MVPPWPGGHTSTLTRSASEDCPVDDLHSNPTRQRELVHDRRTPTRQRGVRRCTCIDHRWRSWLACLDHPRFWIASARCRHVTAGMRVAREFSDVPFRTHLVRGLIGHDKSAPGHPPRSAAVRNLVPRFDRVSNRAPGLPLSSLAVGREPPQGCSHSVPRAGRLWRASV